MKQRILATLILWTLIIALPYYLGIWGAFILVGLFALGSFYELLDLMHRAGRPVDRMVAMAAFVLLLLGFMFCPPHVLPPFAILAIIFSGTMVASLLNSNVGTFARRMCFRRSPSWLSSFPEQWWPACSIPMWGRFPQR
jgi:hypothetical protein